MRGWVILALISSRTVGLSGKSSSPCVLGTQSTLSSCPSPPPSSFSIEIRTCSACSSVSSSASLQGMSFLSQYIDE